MTTTTMREMLELMRENEERTPQDYTKIPATIQAMRHDGTRETAHRMQRWMRDSGADDSTCRKRVDGTYEVVFKTTDGNLATITDGVWLLRGVEGEFYPCQDSIFRKTYVSS